ncbi:MAG: phage tail sheath subtilisin-like domain-containing protein, partial [Leptolyngbyaceae cyanobacterium CAN_BIN12]|nr:phage tail sheath subtilisin-like domain-containing protein [Leptolyngbyaceae cyanobacterium CAN_BIN12]
MATTYKTPGVYIEEIPKFPPSIAEVSTAIPAFIGYTEKAQAKVANDLLLKPKRIVSMLEYELYFGNPQKEERIVVMIEETQDAGGRTQEIKTTASFEGGVRSHHIMYYSMQAYFANGGGPCYIISVGPYASTFGSAIVPGDGTTTFLYAGLAALAKEDEPTLIVFPESQGIEQISDQAALHDAALAQCEKLKDRFVVMSVQAHTENSAIGEIADGIDSDGTNGFRSKGVGANNLKYGAVYAPNIETILNYAYQDTDVDVTHTITGGLNPGSTTVAMNTLQTSNNALYSRAQAAIDQMPLILPPAPAVVGVYARVDSTRGVFKAPANVSLNTVIKPVLKITDEQQDSLNVDTTAGKSINAIRAFTGKGTLIWGARTLAGNDNEWRYIPVRRFFNMAEESIKKATEAFVFEPNDANTWV